MKPVQWLARVPEPEGPPCYATSRRFTICYLARADVPRIDEIAARMGHTLQESLGRISRAAVLGGLFLKGLELAEAAELVPVAIDGDVERLDYLVRPVDLDRLERFRRAHWFPSRQPSPERLQGAFIRLALPLAEIGQISARRLLAGWRFPRKAKNGH